MNLGQQETQRENEVDLKQSGSDLSPILPKQVPICLHVLNVLQYQRAKTFPYHWEDHQYHVISR